MPIELDGHPLQYIDWEDRPFVLDRKTLSIYQLISERRLIPAHRGILLSDLMHNGQEITRMEAIGLTSAKGRRT